MAFNLQKLNWADEDWLKKHCLMSLYRLNRDKFQAVAKALYVEFEQAKLPGNQFILYCGWLAWVLRDLPPRPAAVSPGDIPRAIWRHLEGRGIVSGHPQSSITATNPYYQAMAQFIALQTFEHNNPHPVISNAEMTQALRIISDMNSGQRPTQPVPSPNPLYWQGGDPCDHI
jgi:hypothetical protein